MKNKLIIIITIILLYQIIINKPLIALTINNSIITWKKDLLPSIFPFFIISDILIEYHITNYIPNKIKKIFSYLFNTNYETITIFFLSTISGFPNNARLIKTIYQNKKITYKEANQALIFTHFSNPLFIISTVGISFLHSKKYAYIILISHILGNIILALITRKKYNYNKYQHKENEYKNQNFSKILIKSIKSSLDTSLLILGTITTFLIISELLLNIININPYPKAILKGILEITMGIKSLSLLNIKDIYKVVITTMLISFGGISVHLQVLSQITEIKLSYNIFLISRIFHSIISGIISFIIYMIII